MGTGKTFINLHHRGVPLWAPVMLSNLSAVFRLARIAVAAMMKKRLVVLLACPLSLLAWVTPAKQIIALPKPVWKGFFAPWQKKWRHAALPSIRWRRFYRYGYDKKLTGYVERIFNRSNARKAYGAAEEVAAAVLFLASSSASYITGHTLHVNGGMMMS